MRHAYREGQAEVYEPKPAYVAAKTLTTVLKGYEFSKALALKEDEHVLLFAKGDQLRLAAWSSADAPRTVTIPANAGRFRVTGHLGKELPQVVADDKGLTLTLTGDVQYLAPIDANASLRLAVAWERFPLEHLATAPTANETMRRPKLPDGSPDLRALLRPYPAMLFHTMSNPLNVTIKANDETIIPGGRVTLELQIAACERAAVLPPLETSLMVNGRLTWSQRCPVIISNPVMLHLLTPVSGTDEARLPILVDNQEGTAFEGLFGAVGANDLVWADPEPRDIPRASEKLITIPLRRMPDGVFTLGLTVCDPYIKDTIRSLPERNYRIIPSDLAQWTVYPDGDAKVISTQVITAGHAETMTGLGEQPTLDLNYHLEKGWKFLRITPTKPIDLGAAREIGMWVFSDGSGNLARLRVVDAGEQTFQPDGGRLNFIGWKWLTFAITPHTAHWGGANDGVAKAPLKLDTLFLLDQAD
ncbi:MAG TPA: hypothetical protein VHX44_08515 [Planctomycetota bacterium]|nr:hypothetical protein [Planctomycetota bacterium]